MGLADYVLQRAMTVAEGEQQEILIAKVKPFIASMRRYSSAYSKHLISSMFGASGDVLHQLISPALPVERLLEKCAEGKFTDNPRDCSVSSSRAAHAH
jgi:pumilio RNA-binding family